MAVEFDGKQYRAAAAHQREWGQKLIAELGLQGTERVLDMGCGGGGLTAQLAELVPDGAVVGIDASEGMIRAAREHEGGNLKFELRNIYGIAWAEEFDVVFSNATLNWVKDHRRMLRNVLRALKKGGVARFNFAGDGNCTSFIKVIREMMGKAEYAGYFAGFEWPWYMPTVADYEKLVGEFAFAQRRVWPENADRYFADVQTMVRWVDQPSVVPFLARVAEADKRRFRDEVVARMIQETQQADGRCFETFRRVNFLGKK